MITKYWEWSQEQIEENERLWAEEHPEKLIAVERDDERVSAIVREYEAEKCRLRALRDEEDAAASCHRVIVAAGGTPVE